MLVRAWKILDSGLLKSLRIVPAPECLGPRALGVHAITLSFKSRLWNSQAALMKTFRSFVAWPWSEAVGAYTVSWHALHCRPIHIPCVLSFFEQSHIYSMPSVIARPMPSTSSSCWHTVGLGPVRTAGLGTCGFIVGHRMQSWQLHMKAGFESNLLRSQELHASHVILSAHAHDIFIHICTFSFEWILTVASS